MDSALAVLGEWGWAVEATHGEPRNLFCGAPPATFAAPPGASPLLEALRAPDAGAPAEGIPPEYEGSDYVGFDTMFMVSSIDELGRRQLTDTIRKDLRVTLAKFTIACTKTSSFSSACATRRKRCQHQNCGRELRSNKSLQMFILCRRAHAKQIRDQLKSVIQARKPRKYYTRSSDGRTHPVVPVFIYEFSAVDKVYLHRDNVIQAEPAPK
ncbi:nuclear protein UL3 [Equid herpesvirus 6]|uniref:Nuclear protein UL3 n=1 Tax=Equid herpesvirus 6 TaxID=173566 RepID=A0A7S9VMB3_9ALPH|nr:nuclear protein UL3 [Equid herpesvirus 6]QPI70171.1 nuclear protein UL3 [Equid herpesvirus 6]